MGEMSNLHSWITLGIPAGNLKVTKACPSLGLLGRCQCGKSGARVYSWFYRRRVSRCVQKRMDRVAWSVTWQPHVCIRYIQAWIWHTGDTIIPHNYTFYDFAVNSTRGVENKILFDFGDDQGVKDNGEELVYNADNVWLAHFLMHRLDL